MIDTDRYLRFERVDAVEETARGLLAALARRAPARRRRSRDDVVRVKISRGGGFDEAPTFAVCVGPARRAPSSSPSSAATASSACAPRRSSPRCGSTRSGSTSTAPTAARSSRPPATTTAAGGRTRRSTTPSRVRRRCRPEDPIYGLGEKTGRHNRRRRDFTLWNTDVLDPHATAEFTAGRPPGDPRGDVTSTEFDPYYVSIPFFHHQAHETGAVAASFVDNGYRAAYEFSRAGGVPRSTSRAASTPSTSSPGPGCRDILRAYTGLTGRTAPPPLWALAYHQCRWFRYTQDAVEALARPPPRRAHPVRRAVARHRVHGRLPRVHVGHGGVPGRRRACSPASPSKGFRVVTIVDPGVKHEPG